MRSPPPPPCRAPPPPGQRRRRWGSPAAEAAGVDVPAAPLTSALPDVLPVVPSAWLVPPPLSAWSAEPRTIGRWAAASMLERGARLPQPEKRSAPHATASAAVPSPFEKRRPEPAARSRLRAMVTSFKALPPAESRSLGRGTAFSCRSHGASGRNIPHAKASAAGPYP